MTGCKHLTLLDCDSEALARGLENAKSLGLEVNRETFNSMDCFDSSVGDDGVTESLLLREGCKDSWNQNLGYDVNSINAMLRFTPKVDHKGKAATSKAARSVQQPRQPTIAGGVSRADGLEFIADNSFDLVFTNPPFGTKNNAGIDLQFLFTATRLSSGAVYSFHKTTTRIYILKVLQRWGFLVLNEGIPGNRGEVEIVAEVGFDVSKTEGYGGHKLDCKSIEVDIIRVDVGARDSRRERERVEREKNGGRGNGPPPGGGKRPGC